MVQEFLDLLNSNKIYKPSEIREVVGLVAPQLNRVRGSKKTEYYNIPCGFDIETTSFRDFKGDKVATMYEWTFGLGGAVIVGRRWSEFENMIKELEDALGTGLGLRLICGVHNLSYEFQFIRKRFEWSNVFSMDERKPLYALTTGGIEFRCTYLLSGYSLAKVGENLKTYKVGKVVGGLDYDKMRNYKTPLTDLELLYCVNDVKVVMAYLQELIEENGSISKIPLTKTGFVRRYVRDMCFFEEDTPRKKSRKRWRYRDIMKGLVLQPDEYEQLARAFQGGFTHANPFYTGKVLEDITSFDFTSSYPTVMVAERFPMSPGVRVEVKSLDELKKNIELYCCLFDVEFRGLRSRVYYDSYISRAHSWNVEKAVVQNGRVVSADRLCTTITDVDFTIIEKFYEWDSISIRDFRRYKRGYLPTDFVKAILQLYEDKTTLKGVAGKETEYMHGKENLNSCYGMIVTAIVRALITYNDSWGFEMPDLTEEIEKYNHNPGRFLYYPWGVWVTAYARRNLFSGIVEFGEDYAYSDTDSIKVKNAEAHMKYIEEYNRTIIEQLRKACDFHGIEYSKIEPLTVKGEKKPLGVWDFDGHYKRFKTLGAKRYMVEYSDDTRNKENRGKLSLTVSGLNKKTCIPYLMGKYGGGIFEAFNDDLYIPKGETGKNTHTYIDEERQGTLTDYLGHDAEYRELSCVHLEPTDYSLSLAREYVTYFLDIQDMEVC